MQTAQKELKYYKKPAAPKKRVVKMDGNVAYIDSGFARKKASRPAQTARPGKKPTAAAKPKAKQTATTKPRKKPATAVKPAVKQAKKPKGALISTLAVLFVGFCALALLISRYAAVCAVGVQNNDIEQSIEETQAQIEALQVDMELRDDITYIKNTATGELNMTYPMQDQKIYIDMDN